MPPALVRLRNASVHAAYRAARALRRQSAAFRTGRVFPVPRVDAVDNPAAVCRLGPHIRYEYHASHCRRSRPGHHCPIVGPRRLRLVGPPLLLGRIAGLPAFGILAAALVSLARLPRAGFGERPSAGPLRGSSWLRARRPLLPRVAAALSRGSSDQTVSSTPLTSLEDSLRARLGSSIKLCDMTVTLTVAGIERRYLLHVPPNAPLPRAAILMLHGAGGSARGGATRRAGTKLPMSTASLSPIRTGSPSIRLDPQASCKIRKCGTPAPGRTRRESRPR